MLDNYLMQKHHVRRWKMKAVVLSVILMVCSFANPARADSMRCGSNLVSDGDSKAKVILRCGQPFYKEQVKVESSGQSQTQGQIQKSGPETYNFSGNTSST